MEQRYNKLYVALKYYLVGRNYFQALKALDFAHSRHVGLRKDGITPEFQHQIEIALFMSTLKGIQNEEECITAALLHDTMEDYDVSLSELTSKFNEHIANIVWLLTKKHKDLVKDSDTYFREIADNPVASLVKGSDRVHNIQTMVGVFSPDKQLKYVEEAKVRFLPMLKRARYNFPEQLAAYFNIEHMLKSQIQLIEAMHGAKHESP